MLINWYDVIDDLQMISVFTWMHQHHSKWHIPIQIHPVRLNEFFNFLYPSVETVLKNVVKLSFEFTRSMMGSLKMSSKPVTYNVICIWFLGSFNFKPFPLFDAGNWNYFCINFLVNKFWPKSSYPAYHSLLGFKS